MSTALPSWMTSALAIARAKALREVPVGLLGPEGLAFEDAVDAGSDGALADGLQRLYDDEFETGVTSRTLADGRQILGVRLRPYANDRRMLFAGPLHDLPEGIADNLTMLAGHLADVVQLDDEVVGMTDELVRRYEELNFFFDNEDVVSSSAESDEVLMDLLENCNHALRVDASAMLLHDSTRSTRRIVAGANMDPTAVRDLVGHPALARWLAQIRTPIVLNTPAERVTHGLALPGSERIVACPMLNANRKSLGTLVVFNRATMRDFENSDRNLIAALADKAARVLAVSYDALTGLLMRESFERTLSMFLDEARDQHRCSALLHINVDQIKLVNETFGHDTGDQLLRDVAATLAGSANPGASIARLGGDEFGILLPDGTLDEATALANALVASAAELTCGDQTRQLNVSVSIGVAAVDGQLDSVVEVLARADLACLEAKDRGRGRLAVYRDDNLEMNARKNQMQWASRLQRALKEDRFELFVQTLQPTDPSRFMPHYELLLRMRGSDGEDDYVSPGVFLPVAERYHLMPDIDRWVINRALLTLGECYDSAQHGDAVFAINLSGQSITDEHLLDFLLDRLRDARFPTDRLCFEITETAVISHLGAAQEFIREVKHYGCQFALDDFGAGVSSFTNLRALDLDYLKIDGSFVVDMLTDPISAAMVSAINQVGLTMNLQTVAEFVSSPEIARAVSDLGVTFQQGFFIDEPIPLVDRLDQLAQRLERSA